MVILYSFLGICITIIEVLIIVRILVSIINLNNNSIFYEMIYEITEPFFRLIRSLFKKYEINTGIFDIAPLLLMLILRLAYNLLGKVISI